MSSVSLPVSVSVENLREAADRDGLRGGPRNPQQRDPGQDGKGAGHEVAGQRPWPAVGAAAPEEVTGRTNGIVPHWRGWSRGGQWLVAPDEVLIATTHCPRTHRSPFFNYFYYYRTNIIFCMMRSDALLLILSTHDDITTRTGAPIEP